MSYKLFSLYAFVFLIAVPSLGQNRSDRFRAMGETFFGDDDDKALYYYGKAEEEARKVNDHVRLSNLCVDISSVYHAGFEYKAALDKCMEGFKQLSLASTKPDTVLFKLCSSTGTMYKNLNYKDSTIYYYGRANELLLKNARIEALIPEYVLHHYNSYGRWLNSNGDYGNGMLFIEKALSLAKASKLAYDVNIIRTNIAGLYENLGDLDKALFYRREALTNQKENNLLKCYALSGLGWVLVLTNRTEEGIKHLNQARDLYRRLSSMHEADTNFDLYTVLLYNLGVAHKKLNNHAVSRQYFEKIPEEFGLKKVRKNILLSKTWMRLSELDEQEPEKALQDIQQALIAANIDFNSLNIAKNPSRDASINEKILVEILLKKSSLLAELYRLKKESRYLTLSCKTLSDGMAVISGLRGSLNHTESKLFFTNSVYPFYQKAIQIAFEKFRLSGSGADKEFIFQIIESNKSAALSDALFESSIKPRLIPFKLLNEEQNLSQKITNLKGKLLTGTAQFDTLKKYEMKKHNLVQQFEKDYPQYYRLKYASRTVSVSQIQKRLDRETTYLSYFITNDRLFIAVIWKNGFEIEALNINSGALLETAGKFKTLLYQNPGLSNYTGLRLSASLYNYLITPVSKYISGKTRLIICKDWSLNFLPFDVLESGRYLNDYLIKKYSITNTYSAEIFINPPKQSDKYEVLGIAPFNEKEGFPKLGLGYLPQSEIQVTKISDKTLVGKQALKEAFLKDYMRYGIIYFATHSVMNDKNPNESFIAFNPSGDFRLTTEEIYNLQMHEAKLVVLSSCEAGIGQSHQSEGMFSLARAFSFAGCPAIVTTLWATNDASSAYLTERFDYYIKKNLTKDVALQKAKLDFFNSDFGRKFNHPHFWGNLVLVGNEEPVSLGYKKDLLLYSGIFVVLLFISAAFFLIKKPAQP